MEAMRSFNKTLRICAPLAVLAVVIWLVVLVLAVTR